MDVAEQRTGGLRPRSPRQWFAVVILTIVILILAVWFLSGNPVLADSNITVNGTIQTNTTIANNTVMSGSYIPVNTANTTAGWPVYIGTIGPIENGACVAINSTVDISPIGWGVPEITYYGRYEDGFSPNNYSQLYSLSMPNTPSKLENFYIDPRIFAGMEGFWYQNYNDYTPEYAANLRMFWVNNTCPPPTSTNVAVTVTQINTTIPKPLPWLAEKKTADIALAQGDWVSIAEPIPMHYWLFGYADGQQLLDQIAPENVTVLDTTKWSLSLGDYDMLMVRPGANGILEENYNPSYKPHEFSNATYPAIESPFRTTTPASILGLDPQGIENVLHQQVANSYDDNLSVLHIDYSEPQVTINDINLLTNPTNESWYDVRGYTNVQNNTQLSVSIDAGSYFWKQNKTWSTPAVAVDSDLGVWREYNALIPIDYADMFPGFHNLTVTTPEGGSMTVQFYKFVAPADSYVPPQYISYMGASPYITPVTVTITIPVPGPTRIVIEQLTPSPDQINTSARILLNQDEGYWEQIVAVIIVIGAVLLYARRLVKKKRELMARMK